VVRAAHLVLCDNSLTRCAQLHTTQPASRFEEPPSEPLVNALDSLESRGLAGPRWRRLATAKGSESVITASCHCGAIELLLPRKPRTVTDCNCSLCRRYSGLWAFYATKDVRIIASPGSMSAYVWGDRSIRHVRCRRCGCVTHWEPLARSPVAKMGVNARHLDPAVVGKARVRHFDGASTWKYLD
jgi:hypothetical protein